MKTGIERIAEERARQISQEGWTAENDDQYTEGELERAAAVYADASVCLSQGVEPHTVKHDILSSHCELWPWAPEWLKLTTAARALEKAGALIAAALDRRARLAAKAASSHARKP